jgi:hypothetical protein
MFLNGVLWTPDYPKTLTVADAKALFQQKVSETLPCKLTTIADVICDIPVISNSCPLMTTIDVCLLQEIDNSE